MESPSETVKYKVQENPFREDIKLVQSPINKMDGGCWFKKKSELTAFCFPMAKISPDCPPSLKYWRVPSHKGELEQRIVMSACWCVFPPLGEYLACMGRTPGSDLRWKQFGDRTEAQRFLCKTLEAEGERRGQKPCQWSLRKVLEVIFWWALRGNTLEGDSQLLWMWTWKEVLPPWL